MTSVSAYDAKTHFSALLERAGAGESIVVTRHGRPVARLVPYEGSEPVDEVIATVRRLRQGARLNGLSARELIDEGRRF